MPRYTVYGDAHARGTVALVALLLAKEIAFDLVPPTASLSFVLATRSGSESGPWLRTPEGFVLAEPWAISEWLERCHPDPPLLPTTPVRRTCARILEDWIEVWLPLWPRRSWSTLTGLGAHLAAARFLLGEQPCRPDLVLAAWLETEVLVVPDVRRFLAEVAPALLSHSDALIGPVVGGDDDGSGDVILPAVRSIVVPLSDRLSDDAIPLSLLPVLEEIASDYHAYLVANQQALKEGADRVLVDLGFGKRAFPPRRDCEARRARIGRELAALDPESRRDVRRVLEPVGAWHALTLPPVVEEVDPADPRSL
ncbi:MAG TPA: hypothetical protein ENI85_13875 [Deltaproteobacteria bacterium]|nr:hypothetical protein [Deltaproteobacteria bacterium]